MNLRNELFGSLLFGILLISCNPSPNAESESAPSSQINGSGATFPYPLYARWIQDYYNETGIRINYTATGSGAGIRQMTEGVVDFGATDRPLSQEELDEYNLLQFKTVSGALVPIVNVPAEVELTGWNLLDMYEGVVTTWSQLNTEYPDINIIPVYRSEGSGSTYIFLSYLSNYGTNLGVDTAIAWPTGVGARGNAGIALSVSQLEGAVGYVEYAYAIQNNLTIPRLDGVDANIDTFTSNEWPIVADTYILLSRTGERNSEIIDFFNWTFTNGDETAIELDYIPSGEVIQYGE